MQQLLLIPINNLCHINYINVSNVLLLDAPDSTTTQVREHIESLVESLVGKNLDEVKVIQLFDHPSCK